MIPQNLDRLLDRTHHLLAHCTLTPGAISRGADVAPGWLKKFRAGRFSDPGVVRLQRLYDFLKSQRDPFEPLPPLPPPPSRRRSTDERRDSFTA